MSSVLIVGNVIKDVYLDLAEQNQLEQDEDGTAWLDVAFNGGHYDFFRRTSIFAGAAITLEILKNFDLNAKIAGCKISLKNSELNEKCPVGTYRYILCHNDRIAYLTPTERAKTVWEAPAEPPEWIFVDRSATLTADLIQEILAYLSLARQTKLAIYLDKNSTGAVVQPLVEQADIIFTETELENWPAGATVYQINDSAISVGSHRQRWQLQKTDLMTHLTVHSIVAGTVLAAVATGEDQATALALAKTNAENSSLGATVKRAKLVELMASDSPARPYLAEIAQTLVAPGKGILAADESGGSIHKKFLNADIPDDEAHRRDYRNIFFTTKDLSKYASGVILFDETARQKADDGRDFVSYLTSLGIVPGIKVDQGLVDLPEAIPGEKYTQGLEDLPQRLAEYYEMGLRFAKWRAAFEVSFAEDGSLLTPSDLAIQRNCEILAQYALDCQDAGIVPIVEPELVYDGDYGIDIAAEVTGRILDTLFAELAKLKVDLAGCLLKCNMVLAGKRFALGPQSTPAEVGKATAEVLRAHIPKELAGVVFLSGGQSVEQATENLQAVTNNGPFAWPVTFSFARALQDPALDAWQGNNENIAKAREAFAARLAANSAALTKR